MPGFFMFTMFENVSLLEEQLTFSGIVSYTVVILQVVHRTTSLWYKEDFIPHDTALL